MENQGNNEKAPAEPQGTPGVVPPRRPSGSGKWIAVIVVLIVVIAALVVLTQYHPSGSSAKVVAGADVATLNQPYNLTLQSNGVYKTLTVNWGDAHVQTFEYQGSNKVTLHHVYSSPGDYLISYSLNYGGSTFTNYQSLIPVHITASSFASISQDVAFGLMELQNSTSKALVNNTLIFNPGTNLSFIAGFLNQPLDGAHMVIGQTLLLYHNGSLVSETPLSYYFNSADGQYELSASDAIQNISLASGYYTLGLQTTTGVPMTTTDVSTTVTNTTMVNYAAGQSVSYGNATSLLYGNQTLGYTSVPPVISYTMNQTRTNAMIETAGPTNVTYTSANVTYNNETNLTLPFSSTMTVSTGTNFTLVNGNATVAFLTNGTALNSTNAGGANLNFNNTTASYTLYKDHSYNFAQSTMFQVLSTDPGVYFQTNAGSNFVYSAKAAVTMWNTNNQTYNGNTTLTFTNPSTDVTYMNNANATIILQIPGVSAPLTIGEIDASQGLYTTTYYYNVVAEKNANSFVAPLAGNSFTSAEVVAGGYTTLDPQIAFFTVDSEILINTMMPLVNVNGSSASSFVPDVASAVPSQANGGINNDSTNYTFHVRSGLQWQDGSPVTVYDAYYGLVRLMLFANAQPGTGGYLLGDYLLPFGANGFNTSLSAITHAITYSNQTNNVTLHFLQPVPSAVVFQLIAATEASPIDANWLMAHGDGIQFTPSGFANYSKTGDLQYYNQYVQNHIMADGPYQVSYNLPGSQIVMVANPNFVSPGKWEPKATITTVSIQYFSTPSTAFLELKSGAAQTAEGVPPTPYWPQMEGMAGINNVGVTSVSSNPSLQIHGFPTLGIYFYNFNLNTNTQMLSTLVHNQNVPATLFVNPNVRKAFAYAFNYTNYLQVDNGNALYNTTFANAYAGMLPSGMLYNQSIAQLNALGYHFANSANNGLANANLSAAEMYWNMFVNGVNNAQHSDNFAAMGLKWATGTPGSTVQYKGSALVIPIFVPLGDSVDVAGATTWASVLSQLIPGASFPVVGVTYTQIFQTYAIAGGNPMPISWGGWAPDFVYPTDYEASMSMPLNSSTYMSPASYNPWFLGGGASSGNLQNPTMNLTEQAFANRMIDAYNNGTSAQNATNTAAQQHWFQIVNGYIINQTMQVYLYQSYNHWVISSKINGHDIVNYNENQLVGAGQELMYNTLHYESGQAFNSGLS